MQARIETVGLQQPGAGKHPRSDERAPPTGSHGGVGVRCHTIVRPVRRCALPAAWLWVALSTLGCGSLPMVDSKVDPLPFQDQDLEFLEPGSTDLEALVDELGPAAIVRRSGRLQVWAAAVNQSRVVMVGGGSPYKHHYLVVDLDSDGIVQRFEVVRPNHTPVFGSADPPCTSWGVCVLRDPFEYHMGLFTLGHEELPAEDDIAVVMDTGDEDSPAVGPLPGENECAVYLFNASTTGVWSTTRVATPETPWRFLPEGTYSLLTPPPGRQLIRAQFGPTCNAQDIRTLELDCESARSYYVSVAGKKCNTMSLTLVPETTARETLKKQRLIVM